MAECTESNKCEFEPLAKVTPTAMDNCLCVNINGGGGGTGDGITTITGADPYIDTSVSGRTATIGVQRIADMSYSQATNTLSGVEIGADGTETPFSYDLVSSGGSGTLQIVNVGNSGQWDTQIPRDTPVILNVSPQAIQVYNEALSDNVTVTRYYGIAIRTSATACIAQLVPSYVDSNDEYMTVSIRWTGTNAVTFIPGIPSEMWHSVAAGGGVSEITGVDDGIEATDDGAGSVALGVGRVTGVVRQGDALRVSVTEKDGNETENYVTIPFEDGSPVSGSSSDWVPDKDKTASGMLIGTVRPIRLGASLVGEITDGLSITAQVGIIERNSQDMWLIYTEDQSGDRWYIQYIASLSSWSYKLIETPHTNRRATLWKLGKDLLADWDGMSFNFYGGYVDIETPYEVLYNQLVAGFNTTYIDGAFIAIDISNKSQPTIKVYNSIAEARANPETYVFARMQTTHGQQSVFIDGYGTMELPANPSA